MYTGGYFFPGHSVYCVGPGEKCIATCINKPNARKNNTQKISSTTSAKNMRLVVKCW